MTRVCARSSLLVLSLGLAACGGSAARTEAPAASSPKAAIASERDVDRPNEPANAEVDTDPTLSPAEYEARGMPSIQNPWTARDYQLAAAALVAIAEENPALLPRLNSYRSGPVFRHIVSRENLLVYANRNIDWDLRRSNLITIIEGLSPMSIVYGIMASADPTFEREAREIMLQNAHCVLAMWNLVDEVPEDLRKRAFARPNGAVALSEMQEGTAKVVSGMLLSTEQRVDKSVAALVWYIGELIRVLPPLIDRITPERQAEAIQRIAKLAASEPNPVLAKQFKWLHKAVTAPQKPVAH